MNKSIKYFAWAVALLVVVKVNALPVQDSARTSPFHLSFITPLGTNGLESWNTTNLVSINVLAGYSAGLKGIEVAGFANALKEDMDGIQIAGFCNNTLGKARGLELAGFWNYNHGKVTGMQLAGFANIAQDTVEGFQGAGYVNYAHGATIGQASGFANISTGDVSGFQATGFSNITIGNTSGIQASGFSNITTGTQTGLQASGFFNYAKTLRGVQLGFINVADTVEKGVPVGFLSFVKNGYRVLQIGGNETLYGEVSFKTGTRRFYNILALGATVTTGNVKWGFGYGIGTLIPLGKRLDISIEGVSYQIVEDAWYMDYLNSLNRLNLSLCYNFTRGVGIYAGASWNILVTDSGPDGEFHHHHWNPDVSTYPGFTAGLRIAL